VYLAADIGGTKAHFALYKESNDYHPIRQKKFESKHYSSLEEILQKFIQTSNDVITKACFGIAGPIREGKCTTPNLPWVIEIKKLKNILKTEKVALINDLIANTYGINILSESDFFVLNSGKENPRGNQAIISAGTGLGEAGGVFDGRKHVAFASEGGHCDFLARNEEEFELFHYLKKKFHEHVSIERVLSGPGLENIYHFLVEAKKIKVSSLSLKEGDSLAKAVSERGLNKTCAACTTALEMFLDFYGAEAGNLALKFFAEGGVFIGGGIAPKILPMFQTPRFMQAFTSKGRMQDVLRTIPVKIILNEETALLGAAYYADQYM
jgi:glucokinase